MAYWWHWTNHQYIFSSYPPKGSICPLCLQSWSQREGWQIDERYICSTDYSPLWLAYIAMQAHGNCYDIWDTSKGYVVVISIFNHAKHKFLTPRTSDDMRGTLADNSWLTGVIRLSPAQKFSPLQIDPSISPKSALVRSHKMRVSHPHMRHQASPAAAH